MKSLSPFITLLCVAARISAQTPIDASGIGGGSWTWVYGSNPEPSSLSLHWTATPSSDTIYSLDSDGLFKAATSMANPAEWLEATIPGPGVLHFKAAAYEGAKDVYVGVNGSQVLSIPAGTAWNSYAIALPELTNTVRWVVTPTATTQISVAYLDQVWFENTTQVPVSISQMNGGNVTVSPNSETFESGSIITVTALPNDGMEFSGWTGTFSSLSNPVRITIDQPIQLIPLFLKKLDGSIVGCADLNIMTGPENGWVSSDVRASEGTNCLTNQGSSLVEGARMWCILDGPLTFTFDYYVSGSTMTVYMDEVLSMSDYPFIVGPEDPPPTWKTKVLSIPVGMHELEFRAWRFPGATSAESSFVDNVRISRPSIYSGLIERTSDGYAHVDWAGWFYDEYYPWVYDYTNGWIWVYATDTDFTWWDVETQSWYWSDPDVYPYAYQYGDDWVWIGMNAGKRSIYHYSSGSWN
ncbi:MAG: hypothetical protein JW942_05605 [Opitutales bacterium]|nr:hypothetical protein [Opitutales bacterium]